MAENKLIIEIAHSGLGDHLFHSHIPRIAKEFGGYDQVFISTQSAFVHPEYLKIVWEYNPYVDGFVDEMGIKVDIGILVEQVNNNPKHNLLDEVMLGFGLDNGLRWNKPEVFYKPKFIPAFQKIIYDPNFLSWIGLCTKEDAMTYFQKKQVYFDAIMKIRNGKVLYIPQEDDNYIETPTLEDFCDLIYSCKELHCLTSGTATLAASLGKGATVYYGEGQPKGYQHEKLHRYEFIPRYFKNRFKRKLGLI